MIYLGHAPLDPVEDADLIAKQLKGKWRVVKDGSKFVLLHPAEYPLHWPIGDWDAALFIIRRVNDHVYR